MTKIKHIEWKNDRKKTEGFFLEIKKGKFKRVILSEEIYQFPEDTKISDVEVTVNGRLIKMSNTT